MGHHDQKVINMKTFKQWLKEELKRNSWYDSVQISCMKTAYEAAMKQNKKTVALLKEVYKTISLIDSDISRRIEQNINVK